MRRRCPDLPGLVRQYLRWLEVNHASPLTLKQRRSQLKRFTEWCDARAITRPRQVTRQRVEQYQRALFHHRRDNGKALSRRTQAHLLNAVRVLFAWAVDQGYLRSNPAETIETPRYERKLPREVLTPAQVASVLDAIDVDTPLGLRDRALLELLYSTGVRRAEACGLLVTDLDVERGTLLVRRGKGSKERTVPIGERAIAWVIRYVEEARPQHVRGEDDSTLFLSVRGAALTPGWVTEIVKRRLKAAGIDRYGGGAHLLRHAVATAMLERGADVRVVQELLGHRHLSSTEVYTKVTISRLKEVHTKTHPAKLKRGETTKT